MAELLGATLGATLMVPGQRPKSLTPRYKSRSRSRRSRERSGSPLPYLMRDDREKSPFEVGESHRLQLAASKAVIDKALIMDISKGTEEDEDAVLYLTTDISVIDRACVIDVSPVTLYVLEEDDYDDDESIIDENDSARSSVEPSSDRPSAEPEEGEEVEGEEGDKKKKKKGKKKPKDKKKKKEATPPLTLKLDVKPPPKKMLNKMFESKGTVEEERPKPEPRKKGNKLALGAAFNVAPVDEAPPMKKKEPSKWDKKPEEAPKAETAEEQQERLDNEKEEKKARAQARAEAKAEKAEAKAEAKAQKAEENRVKQEEMEAKVALMTPEEKDEHEAEVAAAAAEEAAVEEEEEEEDSDDEEEGEGEDGDERNEDEYGESREFGTTMDEDDFDEEEEEEEVDPREVVYLTPKDPITNWEAAEEVELEDEPITFITAPKDPPMTEKQRDQEWQRLREANRLPIIHSFLSDRVAPENANVKLTLTVSGPDIQVKWFKGGEQLEKGPRAKMTVREGLLTLEIPNAMISDSGEYSCVVKNKNGDVATTCLVNVYKVIKEAAVPPTFTSVRDFYHLHEDEIIIEAHVRGLPMPKVYWYKDGLEIVASYRYEISHTEDGQHKLAIYKPNSNDSGKYCIKAENSARKVEKIHNVTFTNKESHMHVYGVFSSNPTHKQMVGDTIRRAHEETMKIIAEVQKSDGKKGGRVRGGYGSIAETGIIRDSKTKLTFSTHLRDRTSLSGGTVKLLCSVNGPDPQIRWLKNEAPIEYGPHIKNASKDGIGCIQIENVTPEDSGEYKCIAKNPHTELSTVCKLNVYPVPEDDTLPPTFTRALKDTYLATSNDLIIECKVRGHPVPTITWLRDDQEIELDDRIQQIEDHDGVCQLIINKPDSKDSGVYAVEAENSEGTLKISHPIEVTVEQTIPIVSPPPEPVVEVKMVETPKDGEEGAEVVEGEEGKSGKTSKGTKGGKKGAAKDAKPVKGGGGDGSAVSTKNKLLFVTHLTNRTVKINQAVKLQCCVQGPEPQIKWTKNENPVVFNSSLKQRHVDGLASLEFVSPTLDDIGEYTCFARNSNGEVSTSCKLDVYDVQLTVDFPPLFTRALKDTYHLNTNELIIECHVRGQPHPKIAWVKDGQRIGTHDKYQQFDHEDGKCELIINHPTPADSGKYICCAENYLKKEEIGHWVQYDGKEMHIIENIHGAYHIDHHKAKDNKNKSDAEDDKKKDKKKGKAGKAEAAAASSSTTTTITIEKKPKPATFANMLKDRVIAEGGAMTISCYVDGTEPMVKWQKDGNIIDFGSRVKNKTAEGHALLEFTSVVVEDSGEYKCIARNALGEVSTSMILTVYRTNSSADSPPSFTRALKDTFNAQIKEHYIECHVRGVPQPKVTWVRDGSSIENCEKYHQIEHENGKYELVINNPTPMDSGKYICVAENRSKKVEISHCIICEGPTASTHKRIIYDDPEPEPEPEPEVVEEAVVEEVVVEAEPAKVDKTSKSSKGKPKAAKDGAAAAQGGRPGSKPLPDPKTKLCFLAGLTNRTAPVGGKNVKMQAYVQGPEPQCKWFKNDAPVVFGPRIRQTNKDGLVAIEFLDPSVDDCGDYKCVARNPSGEVSTSASLTIYELSMTDSSPPTFVRAITDSYHSNKNVLILESHISGNPTPLITWYIDGKHIIPNDKYEILFDKCSAIHSLVIKNPDTSDIGLYTCVAANIRDKVETSQYVNWTNKSKPIETNQKSTDTKLFFESYLKNVSIEEGTSLKLTAHFGGKDSSVSWVKDGLTLNTDLRKFITSCRNGMVSLEILKTNLVDAGEYTCIIKNSLSSISTNCNVKILPKFVGTMKDTYNIKTNEISIEAKLDFAKDILPKISWFKEGVSVSENRLRQTIENGVCKLIIKNPNPRDSGQYVCRFEINDTIKEISHYVKYRGLDIPRTEAVEDTKVEKPKSTTSSDNYKTQSISLRPKFTTQLMDRLVAENSSVKLTCNILNDLQTKVSWLKNGSELAESSNKYRTVLCEGGLATLEIFNVRLTDEAEYGCIAKNEYGQTSTYSRIKVFKDYEATPLPPTFTRCIKDSYFINEDEMVLECRVRGHPTPEIEWLKDNQPLDVDDEDEEKYKQFDQLDGYCKLIIYNPTEADNGIYTCCATNSVFSDKISHTVEFTGKDKRIFERTHGFFHRDPNKPHFSNVLVDHIVPSGATIALQTEVHGSVTIEWFKEKEPVNISDKVRTFSEQGVYTLAIAGAKAEDSGAYTCRATNDYGKADTVANVDVINPATVKGGKPALFTSRPDAEINILNEDDLSMSFRLQGDPKPKLTLTKGLKDITKSSRTLKETHDDYTRFTMKRATYSDQGTYCLVARNRHGADRAFVHVMVKQRLRSLTPPYDRTQGPDTSFTDVAYFKNPPGPPSQPIISMAGKNHINLSWMKPAKIYDSAPVVAYRIDAWLVGSDGGAVWKEIGISSINSFDAFNLKSGCQYLFRITPRNRYGWGDSIQTSNAFLMEYDLKLPEFTKILPGQIKGLINQDIKFICSVNGYPKPQVLWYKDGLELESADRIHIGHIGSTCSLLIKNITEFDTGRYTCEATNSQGRVSTFARLQAVTDEKIVKADQYLKARIENEVENSCEIMLPHFNMRLRDRRVQISYPVRLTCQVIGYPIPEVIWHRNGVEIVQNNLYGIWREGNFHTLEILKTSIDDSQIYSAIAKNSLGSVSCSCNLIVDKGIRAYIAPEFYCGLDPLYISKENSEICLSAQIEAYPSVGVTWHLNGIRIRPSRRIVPTLNHDGFISLVIGCCKQRDAGIYTCVASNAVGKTESSCRVSIDGIEKIKSQILIKEPNSPYSKVPMFIKKPRSSNAYEGDTVIIMCEVIGDPKPEVVWLRDFLKPEYYKDAPLLRRIGDGPEYRFEIPNAKLDFTGTYSVIASNCHGETKAIISLQIYTKGLKNKYDMEKSTVKHANMETLPEFSRHLKDLRCCDGDKVTIQCEINGFPEPIIFWEKDGVRITSGTNDFSMEYNQNIALLSINHVYPEDEGEYTCIAENNLGRAYSSACIIVDVPEEKENLLNKTLNRPPGLFSADSTPRSTPRNTPIRSLSPIHHQSLNDSRKVKKHSTPKFYSVPHSRIVEEGENVKFQCSVTGHPVPWSTWDKNGNIVTPSSRINIAEKDDLQILEIEQVTIEDAGLYRITLENDFGRIEATARLDVIPSKGSTSRSTNSVNSSSRRSGSYSKRLMGHSTNIGGRLALSCALRGSSVPLIRKYYHNGNEIFECKRVQFVIESNELHLYINDVQLTDHGEYTIVCEFENKRIISSTTFVNVYKTKDLIPKEAPTIIKHLSRNIKCTEGISIDLLLKVESCVPYKWIWKRNNSTIVDSEYFSYIDHGNGVLALRISDPFCIDSGLYSCLITSVYGESETTARIVVGEECMDNTSEIPILMESILPIVEYQNKHVSFTAKFSSLDNSRILWTVAGINVTPSCSNFLVELNKNNTSTLHILGIKQQHSGEIKCTCTNSSNSTTAYTELAVLPLSYANTLDLNTDKYLLGCITKGPEDCTVLIGSTVILDVYFNKCKSTNVKWLKAGRQVIENKFITIINKDDQSTLKLTNINADQSGKYTVEVSNKNFTDMAYVSVAVEDVPEICARPSCTQEGDDSIAIAWCGPPYDGGCMITGFTLEMQDDSKKWTEIVRVADSLSYTVKQLLPNIKYKFRVLAINVHGCSKPSEPSEEIQIIKNESHYQDSDEILLQAGGDFRNRFDIHEELGKGRFGVVYKVVEKKTNQILAAKIIKCIKAKDRINVQEEIAIMNSLKHSKLLQLAASFESSREIVMIMEYITGGELFERVVADDFTLTEQDCILFIKQICEGVDYMHSQTIVHLDLKPENIMCSTRTSHQIKIIDFGLAQRLTPNARVLFGTLEFISPEIINYEPIGFQSDMWSVGVICYVLLSGLSPFMDETDVDTFANITRADFDFDDEAFDQVSQEAKDFISNLLVHRKEDRLTAKECLISQWLSQQNENMSKIKICTDKLKKFIIRRKWQKTGNAIRALGRMTTLSAKSRRSSAISSSASSSPRPSFSGCLITPIIEKSLDGHFVNKTVKENSCTERSDSGFCECSNCGCNNGLDKKKCSDKFKYEISSEILVSKLQNIAELQECGLNNCNDTKTGKYTNQRKSK